MSGGITGTANAARAGWETLYQISPIYLVGGSFTNAPLGMFAFSDLAGALLGAVQGGISNGAPYAGLWMVLPGGKLVNQSAAVYPYASQQVAANATVQEPLTLSMLFRAPVKDGFGYLTKAAILTSIKTALTAHNNAGGTYTVFTPGLLYENGLLLDVFDATSSHTHQEQVDWQFDFFFPLITAQAATSAFNAAMTKLAGGQPVSGIPSWSTLGQSVGVPPL